jgi:hypothetical protein
MNKMVCVVADAGDPTYAGDIGGRITGLRPALGKNTRSYLKNN